MKYYIHTIILAVFVTLASAGVAFAQAAPYSPIRIDAPPALERLYWSVQLGAAAQLATAVILLVGLLQILPRLRQIEDELKKPR